MRLHPLLTAGLLATLAVQTATEQTAEQEMNVRADTALIDVEGKADSAGYALIRDQARSEPDASAAVWLEAEMLGQNRVRLHLVGAQDGADSLSSGGTIDFGDNADTTLTRLPAYVDHTYPGDGTYDLVLQVEDSRGPAATVFLELSLQSGVRVPLPVVEYERGYNPKPLDR